MDLSSKLELRAPLKRSDAFAIVLPLSSCAEKALKHANRNRVLLDDAKSYEHLTSRSSKHSSRILAKLDFMSIIGRGSLDFGFSRAAGFQLPRERRVSPRHFRLHLDISTATLLLTDTSKAGTYIQSRSGPRLVHRETYRFDDDDDYAIVTLGSNPDMAFAITPGEGMKDSARRAAIFSEYVQSIRQTCTLISSRKVPKDGEHIRSLKRRRSSGLSTLANPAKRRRSSQAVFCF
ncbi:hypothetical protein LTR37_017086 [Vermiconidia calcicola]|uniref:Uncharacterized protein n=1 Tax=Vermiconidia calcicola TaxID=1690605 RepID=A0ACC3ML16_9PEZI|nr:hypothetical protein LTR37_017086 [Vermiconidia calcicola]